MPALVLRTHGVGGLALPDAGLLDVGADAGADCEAVGVVEVVAEVELAEPEGDEEGGARGGLGGGAFEDYLEVGSGWSLLGLLLMGRIEGLRAGVQVEFFLAHFEQRSGCHRGLLVSASCMCIHLIACIMIPFPYSRLGLLLVLRPNMYRCRCMRGRCGVVQALPTSPISPHVSEQLAHPVPHSTFRSEHFVAAICPPPRH